MTSTTDPFHALVGQLDYSMFIVTTSAGGEHAGCLVGFATQSSIDPPRFLACISRRNRTHEVAARASGLAVHFVPADAAELVELFGSRSGHEVDKFAEADWRPGPEGLPILAGCPNWFVGRVLERRVLGDHTGYLLEPVAAHYERPEHEFPFHRAKRFAPGREA
jgi:flavin reductase (DIM6/NTAB) family NADH-FMN oxidoreductase RutF